MKTRFFLLAFFALTVSASLRAQTVETVLRGIQERKLALETIRQQSWGGDLDFHLIDWDGLDEDFPSEGSVTSLDVALRALNRASAWFDLLKFQFDAYDPNDQKLVNFYGGPGDRVPRFTCIYLPSVGVFDESNWREKLRLLASSIDQLRALDGLLTNYQAFSYSQGTGAQVLAEELQWEYRGIAHPTKMTMAGFEDVEDPDPPTVQFGDYSVSASPGTSFESRAREFFEWGAQGFLQRDVPPSSFVDFDGDQIQPDGPDPADFMTYGVRFAGLSILASDLSLPDGVQPVEGAPDLEGSAQFFVTARVLEEDDAVEHYVSQLNPAKLHLGSFRRLDSGKMKYEPDQPQDCLGEFFRWIGLPVPTLDGTMDGVFNPEPNRDFDVYGFPTRLSILPEPKRLRQFPGGGGVLRGFELDVYPIVLPDFTPCSPADGGPVPLRHALGSVETTMALGDLVRVHIGRGRNDQNQQAWLGVNANGFGSLILHGSPAEFDLRYEEDPAKYEPPIGGQRTYDVVDETGSKDWGDQHSRRSSYINAWFTPRLKQVMGGDVLVVISQSAGGYWRTLQFYWAQDAGPLSGGFYTPSGAPFKTMELGNPTTTEAAFPTDPWNLRVIEDGARYYEIQGAAWPTGDESLANFTATYSFSVGPAVKAADLKTEVSIPFDGDANMQAWETDETRFGVKTHITEAYYGSDLTYTPLWTDRPVLVTRTVQPPDVGARTTTYTWQWENDGSVVRQATGQTYFPSQYAWLSEVSFDGGPEWEKSGQIVDFDETGVPTYEYSVVAGQTLEVTHEWADNAHTVTSMLGGQSLRPVIRQYNGDFTEVTVSDGAVWRSTEYYAGPDPGPGENPSGSLQEVDYPGGYREVFGLAAAGGGVAVTKRTGWGEELSAGLDSKVMTDRLGGVASRTVKTSEGVPLQSEVGSSFTPWGAPSAVTDVRGNRTTLEYPPGGLRFQLPTSATDSFGLTASVGRDWLLRPTTVATGREDLTCTYAPAGGVSTTGSSGRQTYATATSTGEMTAWGDSFGVGAFGVVQPGGTSSRTVEGRTVTYDQDVNGFTSAVGNGGGSRGANVVLSVDGGQLAVQRTELENNGGAGGNVVTTVYDALGRVVKVTHPDANGAVATETWDYDDAQRMVTYTPAPGPMAQTVQSVLSPDGTVQTVSLDGRETTRVTRGAGGGGLTQRTEIKDDSGGGDAQWVEVRKEAIDPAGGGATVTPWSLSANAVSVTQGAPGPASSMTVSHGLTGDTVTTTLTQGLPSAVTGTVDGVATELTVATAFGLTSGISGTIGGMNSGMQIGPDRRVSQLTTPVGTTSYTYGNRGGGFQLGINDSFTGPASVTADAVGDLTGAAGPNAPSVSLSTQETGGGMQVTLNGRVTSTLDLLGLEHGKSYPGLAESCTRAGDGTVTGFTVGSAGDGVSATITETPAERVTRYEGGLEIDETNYAIGLRKEVTAPGDDRTFTYTRGAPRTETHAGGPWAGWAVEWVPEEEHGLIVSLQVRRAGEVVRAFGLGYDAHARLGASVSPELAAFYGERASLGQRASLTRQLGGSASTLTTTWSYDERGLLSGLTHVASEGYTYAFGLTWRGPRLWQRQATPGLSWRDLEYGEYGQLTGAALGNGRGLAYGYDERGNRTRQGAVVTQTPNELDQIVARRLALRGFAVSGTVHPKAKVAVQTPLQAGWQGVGVDPQTGEYAGWWRLPATYQHGQTARIDAQVRGVLPPAQPGGPARIAETPVSIVVPPSVESLRYDSAGRLVEDAFWLYTWDGAERLTSMERKVGTFSLPGMEVETLAFGYDAEGRRTTKSHTRVYQDHSALVESSQVLWAGWLPILEQRSRTATTPAGVASKESLGRRWFQWGADLSGTLEGAGGIGGLVAILEETDGGTLTRVLLPVEDGLGNITAVLDAANHQAVARYNFGPFGEPVSESGEADACPFRWQTKWYDPECEHYYFGYRHYDPRLGRWLSRDPLREAGGVNLYQYCGNDPVNRHDANGLAPITNDIRSVIMSEIDQAAGIVDRMGFPEISPNDALALGQAKHAKFAEILGKSEFSDFLLIERSVNPSGGSVQRQRWSDGIREFSHWPKGSRRPDVMILTDSDYKTEALRGGGYSLRGKVESVIDLKTGEEPMAQEWAEDVSRRLKIPGRLIITKRPKVPLATEYVKKLALETEAGASVQEAAESALLSRGKLRVSAIPALAMTAASLYFDGRDAADAANDEHPYVLQDSSNHSFALGSISESIYFPFKSPFTRTRFRKETGWFVSPVDGPFAGLAIPISRSEHANLLRQMQASGAVLSAVPGE